jgi:3-hydroxyisobutyrate dehydrogenase
MRVSFLGLGIMGSRMAANLHDKGFELTVWNRTESVATEFAEKRPGVRVAQTPGEAGEGAELVLTMVVDGSQVEALLLGAEGAANTAPAGALFVDCSTIGPAEALRIGGALSERGFGFLDAPVTGSKPRAESGELLIMVGGPRDAFDRALPVFEAMGTTIVYAGGSGQGQTVKVISNCVSASNACALGQALLVGDKLGVDMDALVAVMAGGSAASTMLTLKAGPMREHDYDPLFKLDHMLKDVRFCLETAAAAGAEFPFAEQTAEVMAQASDRGFGEQDFAAMIEVLESRTGQRL